MKTRMSFVILMLLVLPLVLAACGGGPAGEAKSFLEAVNKGDKDEAEKHVCDKNKDTLTAMASGDSEEDDVSIDCEKDGDDVKCTMEGKDDNGDKQKVTMTFGMED